MLNPNFSSTVISLDLLLKQCNECQQTLSFEMFYKHPQKKDGRCGKCISCSSQREKKLRKLRLNQGSCCECNNPKLETDNRLCEYHYIKFRAKAALGKCDDSLISALKEKLYLQNHQCPYTGEKLTLGINAQVDHIFPRSRFPEQQSDIANLEWVSATANLAKRDLTKYEFTNLCGLIYQRNLQGLV